MDKPPSAERRWDSGSPQAYLVSGLVNQEAWRRRIEAATNPSHRPLPGSAPERLLRATANLYYMRALPNIDEPAAQRLDRVLRPVVGGTFTDITAALEAEPDPNNPAARAFLDDVIHVVQPVTAEREGRMTFADVRELIEEAIPGLIQVTPEDTELAERLVEVFAKKGPARLHSELRVSVLASHLSGSSTVPPYAIRHRRLPHTLLKFRAGYVVWPGNTGTDVDKSVLLLFSKQAGQFTSMRELMAMSDDPQAAHRTIVARLKEFLTSPAPSREALLGQRPVASKVKQLGGVAVGESGVIPGEELESITANLTLSQILDGLIVLCGINTTESAALRAHMLTLTETVPTSTALVRALAGVRGLVNEYRPHFVTETDQLAYSLMEQVIGTAGSEPLPLLVVLRAQVGRRLGNVDSAIFSQEMGRLTRAFAYLCGQALQSALVRWPGQAAAIIKEIARRESVRTRLVEPKDL